MKTIALADIVIPENRQRRTFAEQDMLDLQTSIVSKGLMHPVVLRSDSKTLLAGERRLRAVSALATDLTPIRHDQNDVPVGSIPFVTVDDLSADLLYEAELEENSIRVDLPWQEQAAARKALFVLRGQQAETTNSPFTLSTFAGEITGKGEDATSKDRLEVRDSILIAEHLDDPDVAKAKSQKEAVNIVRRKLADTFDQALDSSYSVKDIASQHQAILGNCVEEMKKLPDAHFDVILTDPPYGVGADTWTPQSGSESGVKHIYEDTVEYSDNIIAGMLQEAGRVCKAAAHLYMFCDIRRYFPLAELVAKHGWDVWYVPIIWSKSGQGNILGRVDGPRKTYEACLYARRGGRSVNQVGADVIDIPSPKNELYAAQKPVALYSHLLRWSCSAGDRVLDPFMGSGTIFPAANELKLFAVGIEVNRSAHAIATKRINHGADENGELEF